MFKKQHQLKASAPLRSSDRRKLISEIISALKPGAAIEEFDAIIPKNTLTGKFRTHVNEPGIFYLAEKDPAFFRIKDYLVPTVYTLWKLPDLLPKIYTNSFVLSKLIDGADLMIPGIYIPPEGLPKMKAGELISICIIGNENQGILLVLEEKGRGVYLLHAYGDFLWGQGSKSEPKDLAEKISQENTAEIKTEDTSADLATTSGSDKEDCEHQMSVEDADAALLSAVYQSLSVAFDATISKPLLPILLNTMYSSYILPSRPIDVDIKSTSWKKLAKFGKALEKMGLIGLKEIKGTLYVKSVNYEHPGLKEYRPFKAPKKPANIKETAPINQPTPITIIDLYRYTESQKPFFVDDDPSHYFTANEVRDRLYSYFLRENLATATNARMIRIDPILCDLLLEKAEYFTIDILAKDQLLKRLLAKMKPFHRVEISGQASRIGKGSPTPVELTLATRLGNKSVTSVTNFEFYGFEMEQLVKDFQTLCACSVSVSALPGKANLHKEVTVQGPQQKLLTKYFSDHGLPSSLLSVKNNLKKKKK
ncbi:hypothetical protein DSO57_1020099 [Entomophthora muscae]|uniref:Uncharacterized protein n=1 Tax=Entomophthora muscae TaxID=34485 RepID=A0ACC2U2A3_9FUNG|nr:hypothetical protein DSO57_1020099 [Entomophthora muscae]